MHEVWEWHGSVHRVRVHARRSRQQRDGQYVEQPLVTAQVVRLGRVAIGAPIYAKVDPKRPQRVVFNKKHWHGILSFRRWDHEGQTSFETLCGDDFKGDRTAVVVAADYAAFDPRTGDVAETNRSTCPECLAVEWVPFVVGAYEAVHRIKKRDKKLKAEKKFRASIPSRFDRIDADEEAPPEPEPLVVDLEPDPEEPLGREPKLRSRVSQGQRVKAAKAQRSR